MNVRRFSRKEFMGLAAGGTLGLAGLPRIGGGIEASGKHEIRRRSLVVVGSAPLLSPDRGMDAFRDAILAVSESGAHAVVVPVAREPETPEAAFRNLVRLHESITALSDLVRLVAGPADLADLATEGRLGILPQLCGMTLAPGGDPEDALAAAAGLRGLGIAVVQPVHNWKNLHGDGRYSRVDQRLTATGRRMVGSLNAAGMLLDLSGMGLQSSLHAMQITERPVVFTNSNVARVQPHPGNLNDAQIDACAETNGLIAISAMPLMVSDSVRPSLEEFLRHVDYVADRVGVDHVAIGLDFDDRPRRRFPSDPLPEPPYHYPPELSRTRGLDGLRSSLIARGFSAADASKILGGNFQRVMLETWT
ncbi:MAG: membrane dipeptidase [Dehalococcoidia bacterium]